MLALTGVYSLAIAATGVPHILLAGALAAIWAFAIDLVMNAWLFHGYQRLTPATWRSEGPKQYLLGTLAILLTGFTYAIFFSLTGALRFEFGLNWLAVGLLFGAGGYAALVLPLLLSISIFINLHSGVIIGLLLDWFLISLGAALICARVMLA